MCVQTDEVEIRAVNELRLVILRKLSPGRHPVVLFGNIGEGGESVGFGRAGIRVGKYHCGWRFSVRTIVGCGRLIS